MNHIAAMLPYHTDDTFPSRLTLRVCFIWLLFAISSLVFIEPAPYDGVLILVGLYCFTFGLRVAPHLSTPLFFLCGYILANLLASILAPDPVHCLKHMVVTFFLIFSWVFFASVIHDNPVRMYKVIWNGYIFSAVLAVCLGLIGFLRITPYYEQFLFFDRVKGPFKDPNVFGPYLIPVAVYLILQLENARGTLNFCMRLGLLLFVVAGVLLSFSRGAWFNLTLACALYTGLRLHTAQSKADTAGLIKIIGLVVMAILAIAIWAVTTIDDISQVFSHRAQLVQDYDQGSNGRFDAILIAINESIIHPLGIGPGQASETLALDPHNLFVHIMVETGWLGAISFSGFIIVTLKEALAVCLQPSQVQKICIVAFVCLVSTLLESMIIHSTHWRHLYVLFGMLWGTISAKRSNIV
jgi:O-antigen ligase